MRVEIALLAGKTADLQTVKSVGVCVCMCSRGRRNNLLLSKKQQMDLTPLILEVLGPRVVDLTQLSFQPRLNEMLQPVMTASPTLAGSSGEAVCFCGQGSGAHHWPRPVCLFLRSLREKSSYCLKYSDHRKREKLGSHQPFKPVHILKYNKLQKADVCSSLRYRKLCYKTFVATFTLDLQILFLQAFIFSWAQGTAKFQVFCH